MGGRLLVIALVVLACFMRESSAHQGGGGVAFFETKIRPVLVEQCYKCHSAQAEKLKGDLRLDTKADLLKGGKDGPVLVPFEPDKSRLIEAIRWTNPDLQMPPKHRLSAEQVADFVQWVKFGAPDPRGAATPAIPATASVPAIDYAAARSTRAWGLPKDHPIPDVTDVAWCKSPIDRFILAKLGQKGLKPAAPADKRTLIRRAYFDLIGLPPKPEEVEAFVADESPDAFARVIDRLLASPHYGERWGRHWLDVVRYADAFDSRSVKGDTISPGDVSEAWRYRDWVVQAFNDDLCYDQFILNQVAGDLLPGKHPGEFNADGLVATGMYVIGNWPGGDADKEKMMTDIVDDQIDVTGRAFLGITLACARCHDHKFDPVSTRDYYGMAGIFFSTHILPSPGEKTAGSPVLRVAMESSQQQEARKRHDVRVAELQKKIEEQTDEADAKLARAMLPKSDRYVAAAFECWKQADRTSARLDSVAREHGVDPFILSRWVDYLGPLLRGQPPRKLLSKPVRTIAGIAGVDGWQCPDGRDCPNVAINATDRTVSFSTLTLPAKGVSVHPGPTTGVAVGWTSPIAGPVSIRGKVIDADPNCGDGIDWRIEHARQRGLDTLASGAFPNGGNQAFEQGDGAARLRSIDVKVGDVLQLTVFPKAEYTCDTTVVELEIVETGGGHRVWNLSRDVVPDALVGGQGNPHADSYNNPGVWQFFEAGEERATGGAPPDSVLAHWLANASGRREDAQEIRDTLLALDDRADEAKKAGKRDLGITGPDVKFYQDVTSPRGPMWGPVRSDVAHLPAADREQLAKRTEELTSLLKVSFPPITYANAIAEGGTPQSEYEGVHDWYILNRGRYDRKGERVPRCFPRLLAGDHQPPITRGSGRLELARWIASPDNPMTAKVMVNRIWQHHFGEGIVRTPNNYGKLGTPPTHPELLDWMALRFIDSGWSIKAMHRMIMLSAAYQQSSEGDPATMKADPANELFGRMNRQRLEAEPMRDAMLAVTSTLDETPGGPSTANVNTPRRTLYLMTVRSDRSNYRMLFDAPDPTGIADHRIDSIVAPQALFLMNSPFVLEKVKLLARRVLSNDTDEKGRIDWLYRLLYSRPPENKELEIGLETLNQSGGSTQAAWEQYCQVLLCGNEFVYVD
jgi:hypothetical protein